MNGLYSGGCIGKGRLKSKHLEARKEDEEVLPQRDR